MNKSIFDNTTINHLALKNRLIRSATWEGLANPDGSPTQKQLAIYEQLASGGVGLIITGFTGVTADDNGLRNMMRLCDDTLIPAYQKLVDSVHGYDCKIMAQLAMQEYCGKNATGGIKRLEMDDLNKEDVKNIIRFFSDAALRAQNAGFDGV